MPVRRVPGIAPAAVRNRVRLFMEENLTRLPCPEAEDRMCSDMRDSFQQYRRLASVAIVALLLATGSVAHARETPPAPPSLLYGELFERIQGERLFPDSKTFADARARSETGEILRRYQDAKGRADFSLREFVTENFDLPGEITADFHTRPRDEIRAHIDRLWATLTRAPQDRSGVDSLLAVPTRYVVPGGRFREMYYWDSYFTMLGLQVSGRHDLVADMVENFASLVDRYGHIPNGTRSYYLSRSQPPFFAAMVELHAQQEGAGALVERLPQLQREHDFWMDGAETLARSSVHRRVVRLADGSLLNRYWDDLAIPRDEAYLEDVETARAASRPPAVVYRELRAGAESGWDFSSRWFADGKNLSTIHTTDFLPVGLNSLLYQLELVIARGCKLAHRPDCTAEMSDRARARQKAMLRLMWDEKLGAFVDYDWRLQRRQARVTAVTAFPLFVNLASRGQAQRVAHTLRDSLLMPHGLATSTEETGQQWDAPNGWAPLQWIAVAGLRNYGHEQLAADIAAAWVAENTRVYCNTGKLVEK